MATFNRAYLIEETLISIRNQTYQNWECLIIDDGGTDNTLEVILPFLNSDNRFQFKKRPKTYKKGLPGCRNFGLDQATGDYIVFFDDDDIVHPSNLKIATDALINLPVDYVNYLKQAFIDSVPEFNFYSKPIINTYLSKDDIEAIITQKIGLASCSVMWSKHCFETIRFSETLLYAEEWECYSKIVSQNFKGVKIDNVLYFNKKHKNSNTGEYYAKDSIRVDSKIRSMEMIIDNLYAKNLITAYLTKYFIHYSFSFKNINILNRILSRLKVPLSQKMYYIIRFYSLPLVRYYKLLKPK